MTAPAPVLRVQDLSYSYPRRHVYTAWSADFGPGLHWLRGPNGSGKSTLLKLLAGALPPLAGRLQVRGFDAATLPLDYRREVFWCGPGPIAFDHLRAPEYHAFLSGLYPRFDVALADALARELGLADHLDRRLSALSTGTQRKVGLAAALACGTAVVLLDEPLNALDRGSLAFVQARLAACAADPARAWIVASHEEPAPGTPGVQLLDLQPPAA